MNNKSSTETAKKIFSVYGPSGITDCQIRNSFFFGDMSLRDETRPGQPYLPEMTVSSAEHNIGFVCIQEHWYYH